MIELTAQDGHTFSAYRADPEGTPRGAVVVLPEGAGVEPDTAKLADAFAARGYLVLAPSLAPAEGASDAAANGRDRALADIQATVDYAKSAGKVAVVGYSAGGYLAYAAANRVQGLACAIGYYGEGIVQDFREKRKAPTLLHFGENDAAIPFAEVGQFRFQRPDVSAFSYPGAAHGFAREDRETYDAAAAKQALDRTLFWISQYVEGQEPIALKNAGAYAAAKVEKKKKPKASKDDMGPPMD